MIEHLDHSAIDKNWWDDQLAQCENRNWYAQSWVLDIASPGWEAMVDKSSGAVMPLTWRRKFGVDYVYQPYGLQQLGLFAPKVSDDLQQEFLHAIPKRFAYWDICLNIAVTQVQKDIATIELNTDHRLCLSGDKEALRRNYSKNMQRNLKKPIDAELAEIVEIGADEFVALFAKTTATRYGNTPGNVQVMGALIHAAIAKQQCAIKGIRIGNDCVSAACFIEWGGSSIFFKSANNDQGQEHQAMFRIMDDHIAANAGSGLILDFAGSNAPSVARFNTGFGALPTVYLRLKRNKLPVPLKWFKK